MVIGHQKQWQYLTKSAELDKLPHAFLFSGPEKLGKKTLAIEFAKLLLGDDIQKREHPDFVFVAPIKKEIQISQIRELIWRLSLKPSIALFKVAIIDQAHCLNQEAQSALLKTLEEPKGNTLLILISEYPEMLFPTVLSRLQKIKFFPVKKKEIEDYLKKNGLGEKEAEEILRFSLLKPGRVIDFISDPQKLRRQKKAIMDLIKISNSDLALRFQYAKDLSQTPDLRETLNIWPFYFRDVLLSKIEQNYRGSTPTRAERGAEMLAELRSSRALRANECSSTTFQLRSQLSLLKLKNILKQIQNTNFLISTTNANPRLALEILMMEL